MVRYKPAARRDLNNIILVIFTPKQSTRKGIRQVTDKSKLCPFCQLKVLALYASLMSRSEILCYLYQNESLSLTRIKRWLRFKNSLHRVLVLITLLIIFGDESQEIEWLFIWSLMRGWAPENRRAMEGDICRKVNSQEIVAYLNPWLVFLPDASRGDFHKLL